MIKEKKPILGLVYAIKCGDKYLQGIEANDNYIYGQKAPTMGNAYTYSQFRTVWGDEPRPTEKLTVASWLKVLFEEHIWQEQKIENIIIEPIIERGNRKNAGFNGNCKRSDQAIYRIDIDRMKKRG